MRPTIYVALACLVMLGVMAGPACASVITFDDAIAAPIGTIPNGYAGLDWNNMGAIIGAANYSSSGYENGTVSGDYVAYNEYANIATASGSLFDFNGAYLTAAWNNGLSIQIEGLLGGVVQYDQTVVVDTTGPTWFDFNYLGIDALRFRSFGGANAGLNGSGQHFAMDDLTINETVEEVVPEPISLALWGCIGAVGLIAARRRKA